MNYVWRKISVEEICFLLYSLQSHDPTFFFFFLTSLFFLTHCCSLCILSGQTTAKRSTMVGTSTQLDVSLHYFDETLGFCLETVSSGKADIISEVIVVKTHTET